MSVIGIDLGGTKLAGALFNEDGKVLSGKHTPLEGRSGKEVGKKITGLIALLAGEAEYLGSLTESIGISVPGISNTATGKVWAPNIPGWTDYPLYDEVKETAGDIPVVIESDRACHIMGEVWQGNASGCMNAVFLAIGTGIGAGILVNGEVLQGSHNIAGATGWMALNRPYDEKYRQFGCFEYYASGDGIARYTKELLASDKSYSGILRNTDTEKLKAHDIFSAYDTGDPLAGEVISRCIELWGMAAANIVSLFNPERLIFGGGVFGPAVKFIPAIREEAARWAQPVAIHQVTILGSLLGGDAGIFGAGYLALKNLNNFRK